MHPLTLLCFGMYCETLPNQDGTPVRMVIPWKYRFKNIKSIVKIRFVKDRPPTTWNITNAREYGFYSDVSPNVDHPALESGQKKFACRAFSRLGPRSCSMPMETQVASLYAGTDLRKYY